MSPSATRQPLTIARNTRSRSRGTGAQHPWNAHHRILSNATAVRAKLTAA
jgi:hypothetical protein